MKSKLLYLYQNSCECKLRGWKPEVSFAKYYDQ